MRGSFDYVTIGSYASFYCNVISIVFLYNFSREVFGEQGRKILYYIVNMFQLLVIPFLMIDFFIFSIIPDFEIMELIILGFHLLCSFTIYVVLIKNATKLQRNMSIKTKEDILVKKGLIYMSLTGFFMFITVLMFIFREVLIIIPLREYITVTLGWILGLLASLGIYIGYIAPKWVRDRWIR